jgi:hypothetical protein
MLNQDRAFSTARLPGSGLKNVCALSMWVQVYLSHFLRTVWVSIFFCLDYEQSDNFHEKYVKMVKYTCNKRCGNEQ